MKMLLYSPIISFYLDFYDDEMNRDETRRWQGVESSHEITFSPLLSPFPFIYEEGER